MSLVLRGSALSGNRRGRPEGNQPDGKVRRQQPPKDGSSRGPPEGFSPSAIRSAKVGGATRVGEKFAAEPVTGVGSMNVPVATSPGRSGFVLRPAIPFMCQSLKDQAMRRLRVVQLVWTKRSDRGRADGVGQPESIPQRLTPKFTDCLLDVRRSRGA